MPFQCQSDVVGHSSRVFAVDTRVDAGESLQKIVRGLPEEDAEESRRVELEMRSAIALQ